MPTDGSIAEIYKRLSLQKKVETAIPTGEGKRTEPHRLVWCGILPAGTRRNRRAFGHKKALLSKRTVLFREAFGFSLLSMVRLQSK